MAKVTFADVDAYLASHPPAVRRVLQRVRTVIRNALPGAVEAIAYQIPAYKIDGRVVLYFAGWSEHLSLYPIGPLVAATLKSEVDRYQAGRGTLKIPLDEPLPVHFIARVAKLRAEETAARAPRKAAKKAKKKKAKAKKARAKKAKKPKKR